MTTKKDTLMKVINTIKSCKTNKQLIVAKRMVINFNNMYPDFFKKNMGKYPTLKSMFGDFADLLDYQKRKIDHIGE